MPILIALVVAVIIVAVVARRNAPTRNCRWREDRVGSKGALIKYNCITCGAEVFRSNGKPDSCMSSLKTPGL
ncbi:MAG: hypothetical protein WA790_13750 [Sulfitobacter sp.]